MSARLFTILGLGLLVGSTAALAQPKKDAKKGPPPAPVKDPAAGDPGAAPGDGSGSAATAPDEPPPKDMEGKDENPDNPKGTEPDQTKVVTTPEKKKSSGYPLEEALRPITMPQNMSEISLSPHAQISPYEGADALRARYGIVRQVQLGLTYVIGGIYHEPNGLSGGGIEQGPIKFKPGKAVGLDLTVLLQDWVGVKVGVPVYIDPVAVSITLGIPMKFQLLDGKLAIGGLDDLLAVRVKRFAPSFYQEKENADYAFQFHGNTNPTTSRGYLRFSAYGIYQQDQRTAITGRIGLTMDDFSGSTNASGHGGETVFIRGGVDYAVRHWADIGISLGWDDLSNLKTFAPQLYGAIRI